ncbi:hypothetical protein EBQ34_10780, partial [Vandammella animalimorsus]
ALALYEQLRQLQPDNWRGYAQACIAHRQLGQWAQADAVLEQGLQQLGEHPQLLIAYGDNAMDQRLWELALQRWQRLRQTHPGEDSGWLRAAQALLRLQRDEQAQQLLAQGIERLGERAALQQLLGQVQEQQQARLQALWQQAHDALHQQRSSEALALYEQLRQLQPNNWLGYAQACIAHRQLGQWAQADAVLEQGMQQLGEHPQLLIAYGDNAMDQRLWELALQRWQRLRQAHPQQAQAHLRAAEACLRLNQREQAQALLKTLERQAEADPALQQPLALMRLRLEAPELRPSGFAQLLPRSAWPHWTAAPSSADARIHGAQVSRRARRLGLAPLQYEEAHTIYQCAGAQLPDATLPLLPWPADAQRLTQLQGLRLNGHERPSPLPKQARQAEPTDAPFQLTLQDCQDVLLENLDFTDLPDDGLLLLRCRNVWLRNCRFHGQRGAAIVVASGCAHVTVEHCEFTAGHGAAILIGEGAQHIRIAHNRIEAGQGKSNWMAGIVVTDRSLGHLAQGSASLFGPDGYWAQPEPICQRLLPPRGIVLEANQVIRNLSSGIYLDGAIETLLIGNQIESNSKEGICLDYGATKNLLLFNQLSGNGNRWGKSDEDLARDFVAADGRLPDGTARAKVPAISIDNALHNLLLHNFIHHNFGSGIKIVRTGFGNLIADNHIAMNGLGGNARHMFFGVELGFAPSDLPPSDDDELDFLPSLDNCATDNHIIGWHDTPIYSAPDTAAPLHEAI